MSGIRIGVNALYLIPGGVGGTEIYLRSLLAALAKVDTANSYVVFTNRETGADLLPQPAPHFAHAPLPVRAQSRPARILYEQVRLPGQANRHRIDVLFNPGFTAPVFAGRPQVTVIHDLQHKRHPEYFRWFDLPAWRFLVWASVRRSTRLIAVSEATRTDLLHYYQGLQPDRIGVVQHGVDSRFFEIGITRSPADPPFVLCVSTLHPHKNIERLVRAFARVRTSHPNLRLVLAGMKGFHTSPVETLIASMGLADAVEVTGWIPRDQLLELFRRAAAFVYPSTFEGFGMPVLEALAAGLPTACSDIEPLRGIAGGAALLFPPEDESAMADVLSRLLRGEMAPAGGPSRAAQFSWDEAARQTVRILEAAART